MSKRGRRNSNIVREIRRRLLSRDGYRCFWCGAPLTIHDSSVDHIIPRSFGGTWWHGNLVLSCKPCNIERGNMNAEDYLEKRLAEGRPVADRWRAEAAE